MKITTVLLLLIFAACATKPVPLVRETPIPRPSLQSQLQRGQIMRQMPEHSK